MEDIRKDKVKMDAQVEILTAEKNYLSDRKKKMDDNASQDLISIKDQLSKTEYPPYFGSADKNCEMTDKMTDAIVHCVFESRPIVEKKISDDHEMTEERTEELRKEQKNIEIECMDLVLKYPDNPISLKEICKYLSNLKEYDYSMKLGVNVYDKIDKLIVAQKKN